MQAGIYFPLASKVKGLEPSQPKTHVHQDYPCWKHWRQRRKQTESKSLMHVPFLQPGAQCTYDPKNRTSADMKHQALFYKQWDQVCMAWKKLREKSKRKRPVHSSSLLTYLKSEGSFCGQSERSAGVTQEFLWQTNYCLGTISWPWSG